MKGNSCRKRGRIWLFNRRKMLTSWRILSSKCQLNYRPCGLVVRLQIQRSKFESQRYQISGQAVGLERGAPSLVSTIMELLEIKSSGSGLESQDYGRRDPSPSPHVTPYPQKLALTWPTSGGRSVDRVRSRTKTTELYVDLCPIPPTALNFMPSIQETYH
jgi:hypothetical protein